MRPVEYPHQVPIHGTYPWDGEPCRWKRIRSLEVEEVLEFVAIPGVVVERARANDRGNGVYLWLNKGYIVCGKQDTAAPSGAMLLHEQLTDGEVGCRLPVGTRAVYLHDGRYSLIEVVAPCPACYPRSPADADAPHTCRSGA